MHARPSPIRMALCVAVALATSGRAHGDVGLGRVPALTRRGDAAAALRALGSLAADRRAEPRARYLRARLLERLGRLEEAAVTLADLEEGLPAEVTEDARHRRGRLLARAGRCAEALPLLEEAAASTSQVGWVARGTRAECLLALGRHEEALDAFATLIAEDPAAIDHFAARLGHADALVALGRDREAIASLSEALVARPAHPDTDLALARLGALGVASPSFTYAQRLERAERLGRALRHEEALAELDAAGRPAVRTERAHWLHLRGMALYRTRRRYAEAAEVLRLAYVTSGRQAVDDAFHAARALSRADRDTRAIAAYHALVRAHPQSPRAAQAEFLAAWLELRHRRAVGETHMRRFLAGPRAGASIHRRRAALWELALRAFERRRYATAAELFQRYAQSGAGAMIEARGRYWAGRAREATGGRREAIEDYRRTLAVEPLHWYALLAAQRLRGLGEEPGAPFDVPLGDPERASTTPPALPSLSAFYAELGLRSDAVRALRTREVEVRRTAPEGEGLQSLIAAYGFLGEANRPYRLVAGRAARLDAPTPANRWLWDALYPQPWRRSVRGAAAQEGIDPAYVYATMRQESAYDPDSVSPAEAIGLLQLIPESARRRAEALGLPMAREMLFAPAWNIRLGTAEIGALYRRFGGCMPLSIAAYNAGAHRVDAWREGASDIELDRFVERIPFDETRNYVRRVMSHYARYRYLAHPEEVWPGLLDACEAIGLPLVR